MPATVDEAADQQVREGADSGAAPATVSFAVREKKRYRILCPTGSMLLTNVGRHLDCGARYPGTEGALDTDSLLCKRLIYAKRHITIGTIDCLSRRTLLFCRNH
jgi:hypothetical protein